MYPELFHLGPFIIRTYSVILDIGVVLGLALALVEARRIGLSLERFVDVAIVALFGGVIGARLYFVLVNWPLFESDLLGILRMWEGGLVLHGALIGGVLAAGLYLRLSRISFFWVADMAMPAALLTQAVGRIGCLLNGCCYGQPTTLPWGISLPLAVDDVPRHPTPLYELTGDLIVLGILWTVRKRKPFDGFVFSLYLILYSLVRVIVEFWRGDPAEVFGELRFAQVMSLFIAAAGFALMGYLSWRTHQVNQAEAARSVAPGSSIKEDT